VLEKGDKGMDFCEDFSEILAAWHGKSKNKGLNIPKK
jgi:hypothetical protein